jgi:hypothetical protein
MRILIYSAWIAVVDGVHGYVGFDEYTLKIGGILGIRRRFYQCPDVWATKTDSYALADDVAVYNSLRITPPPPPGGAWSPCDRWCPGGRGDECRRSRCARLSEGVVALHELF